MICGLRRANAVEVGVGEILTESALQAEYRPASNVVLVSTDTGIFNILVVNGERLLVVEEIVGIFAGLLDVLRLEL